MTPRERAWLRRWIDAHADPNADADAQRDLIRARAIVDRAEGEAERIREAVARAYEVVPAAAPVASAERRHCGCAHSESCSSCNFAAAVREAEAWPVASAERAVVMTAVEVSAVVARLDAYTRAERDALAAARKGGE